jgi:hypothetical protein
LLAVVLHQVLVRPSEGADLPIVLLYLGPETIMPVASAVAAVIGFLLIFWRMIVNGVKRTFRAVTGRGGESVAPSSAEPLLVDTADEIKDEVSHP